MVRQLLSLESTSSGAIIGLVMAALVGLIIIGGIKRIASVTEKIVPFMALLYLIACSYILIVNVNFIDDAFRLILNEAFNPKAIGVGGVIGVLMVGFKRAAFSNEAGAGSASIAHAAVKTNYPIREGIVASLGPLIDTIIVCTATAIVIILGGQFGNKSLTASGNIIDFEKIQLGNNKNWNITKSNTNQGSYLSYNTNKTEIVSKSSNFLKD